MKTWIAHDGEPTDCAVLVFANSSKRAKKIGFDLLNGLIQTDGSTCAAGSYTTRTG